MYRVSQHESDQGVKHTSIIRIADGAGIPTDPANRDYQEYLKWVAEGNTPQPAEGTE